MFPANVLENLDGYDLKSTIPLKREYCMRFETWVVVDTGLKSELRIEKRKETDYPMREFIVFMNNILYNMLPNFLISHFKLIENPTLVDEPKRNDEDKENSKTKTECGTKKVYCNAEPGPVNSEQRKKGEPETIDEDDDFPFAWILRESGQKLNWKNNGPKIKCVWSK